jgi:hypothetical protein
LRYAPPIPVPLQRPVISPHRDAATQADSCCGNACHEARDARSTRSFPRCMVQSCDHGRSGATPLSRSSLNGRNSLRDQGALPPHEDDLDSRSRCERDNSDGTLSRLTADPYPQQLGGGRPSETRFTLGCAASDPDNHPPQRAAATAGVLNAQTSQRAWRTPNVPGTDTGI